MKHIRLQTHLPASLAIATAFVLAGCLPSNNPSPTTPSQIKAGENLYRGNGEITPNLVGRLQGHTEMLPPDATRCSNCHGDREDPPSNRFAPLLNQRSLTQPLARRGGPASVYDSQSLCKLLRDGIDPAWIMINQSMPRYMVTDQQCQELWQYLTRS